MFWAVRDPEEAEKSIRQKLNSLQKAIDGDSSSDKVFALMFPDIGRGPEFFNGIDQDFEAFRKAFPDTPMIGFYGNGEISPGISESSLIKRYSTVVTVFTKPK